MHMTGLTKHLAGPALIAWILIAGVLVAGVSCAGMAGLSPAAAEALEPSGTYQPIAATDGESTITLTGHDLTIGEAVAIARDGAKVELSKAALDRSAAAYGLLLEGAAEGVPIYWFNRGSGAQRETVIFSGDPTSEKNTKFLKDQQLARFKAGVTAGYGPEIQEEALIRAIMAIRANTMSYEAASPALTRMLVDLINHRITPVVQSRGTLGEGDLATLANIGAAMVGEGEVYYQGQRMPAAKALSEAGLKPLEPFAADQAALISTNAYAQAQAVLLLADAKRLLDWTDLSYAIDLNGMNSSLTPLAAAVQEMRPYPWLRWDAARVMEMLKGSYLFEDDPARIIQDPESLRASSQRQGSAWQAWAELRDSVILSINASDHNPAVLPGLSPNQSWELGTPQFMKYHVKGGKLSNGQSGYIFSNANWDPYPMANQVEAFSTALSNMGVAVAQRIERFNNPFFTVIKPGDVIAADDVKKLPTVAGYLPTDLWQDLADITQTPVAPNGQAIIDTVEDLQAQTRIKLQRARRGVDSAFQLVAQDVLKGMLWMDLRKAQTPSRSFGEAPTAALAAFRKVVPLLQAPGDRPRRPLGEIAYEFIRDHPASDFYKGGPVEPAGPAIPKAGAYQ